MRPRLYLEELLEEICSREDAMLKNYSLVVLNTEKYIKMEEMGCRGI